MKSIPLHAQTALLAGWRIRSSHIVLALALLAILAASIAGSFSGRQPQTVMIDIGFSLIRFLSLLLGLYWVQELVAREIERRTVLWVCAGPASRSAYVLGRFLGILILLSLALALFALVLYVGTYFVAPNYQQSSPVHLGGAYVLMFVFLWFDLMVAIAATLMITTLATVSMMPFFLGLALSIAMRSLGPALTYLAAGDATQLAGLQPVLNGLQWVLPDLSLYDLRAAVLYGKPVLFELMWAVPVQAICYSSLLLALACRVFSRREFN